LENGSASIGKPATWISEQFRMGLAVELEHGTQDPSTDVTDDDEIITGKIALAHLNEFADYYTRLAEMEGDVEDSAPGS
jgi:hypothetical protein